MRALIPANVANLQGLAGTASRSAGASRPAVQPSNLAQSWASVKGAARLPAGQGIAVSKRRPSFRTTSTSVGNSPSALSTGWRWMRG